MLTSTPFDAPRARPMRRRVVTVAVATAVSLIVAGGSGIAYAAAKALDGGGAQPEAALPSSVVALAKLDLDPAFGQKRALYQLSRKFPRSGTKGPATLKDDLLRSLFDGTDVDYDRDVKAWIGNRAAVGAVPDSRSESGFDAVAAVQYTDITKTRAALRRVSAAQAKRPAATRVYFAFRSGYVLIARSQAKATAYAASAQTLSAVLGYQQSMATLAGDQIATAWVNVKATYLATPKAQRKLNPLFSGLTTLPTGYLVAGVHAASSYIEMQGKTVGTNEETNRNLFGGLGVTAGANLLASYPADTKAGIDVVGLGDAVVKYYNSSGFAKEPEFAAMAKDEYGITLPADLRTLLGEQTAIGVMGAGTDMDVVARILSVTPVESAGVASKLVNTLASSRQEASGLVRVADDGYYVGTSRAAVTRTATATAKLGDTVSFRRALPDAAGAGLAVYVNVQGYLRGIGTDGAQLRDLRNVDAFGFTVSPATGSFRMRLTVK